MLSRCLPLRLLWCLLCCMATGAVAPVQAAETRLPGGERDLFLGEAFYYAGQERFFDAISRLDAELLQYHRVDERDRDPLHIHAGLAHFSVGDFELSYRMHNKAGRAIAAVLEGNVRQSVRNEAAYRLARIYYEKGDHQNALLTIERIDGALPERVRDDERLLRAQIYIVNDRHADAVEVLRRLERVPGYEGFAGYNMGVALIQQGDERRGLAQLDRAGQIRVRGNDPAALAIRDKANLVLGFHLLQGERPEEAAQYLNRVRLEGPFSNRALLGSGWSGVAQARFDRTLVPWSILYQRNPTDKAVQESLLGVPYAYANLDMHGRAALLYGEALEAFDRELDRLHASIESIREGHFFRAMVREEIRLDSNWLVRLRELPESPETWYLMELMASNDFQTLLKNYLDLEDMRQRQTAWLTDLDAYEDVIAQRRDYYAPLLPGIDARFRVLDSMIRLRMEQRQSLDDRLQRLLVAPDPKMLMTADERLLLLQLDRIEDEYRSDQSATGDEVRRRVARLRGRALWDIETAYPQRLTEAFDNLRELDQHVQRLDEIYAGYVRTRQAATQSYQGYDERLRSARARIRQDQDRVAQAMKGLEHMLERMAIAELEARRDRLEQYRVRARFAMAESYDRAVKAQQQALIGEGAP